MFWSRRTLQVCLLQSDLVSLRLRIYFLNFAHRTPPPIQPIKARQPVLATTLGATMMLLNGLFGTTMFINNSETLPPMPCWVNEYFGISTFMAQAFLYMLRYVV